MGKFLSVVADGNDNPTHDSDDSHDIDHPRHYHLENEEEDDDTARSVFGTKEYWDELYLGRGDFPAEEYTWYFGWDTYQAMVQEHVSNRQSSILLPGIGNDPLLLDLLQKGYQNLTATDYSQYAIDRQRDLLSYLYSWDDADRMDVDSGGGGGGATTTWTTKDGKVQLKCMDARKMDPTWTNRFDAVLEKGALDAIYLSGDGNLERTVQELERVLKPGGTLISISGVVPEELRRRVFSKPSWVWIRDGSNDLKAGCFVFQNRKHDPL